MRIGKKGLKRTEFLEYIKSIMPDGLSEIEKSAFIAKQIADNVVFDEVALWSDRETKIKIYRLAKEETKNPDEVIKRKLICVNMSELYRYIATQIGLTIEYKRSTSGNAAISENEMGGKEILDRLVEEKLEHVCPIQVLSDGRRIRVDIQGDLHNLKTRSRPIGFGTKDDDSKLDTLEGPEIDAVFRRVYGLDDGESFTDEYIQELNEQLSREQLEPTQKIKRIIEDLRIQNEAANLGVYEAKRFYEEILIGILGIQVFGTFFQNGTYAHIGVCSISDNKTSKKYSIYLYAQDMYDEEKLCYIFSKKTRKMISVSPEELYQMSKQGMTIRPVYKSAEDRNRITIFMENAINSYIRRGESSALKQNELLDLEQFFIGDYEEEEK